MHATYLFLLLFALSFGQAPAPAAYTLTPDEARTWASFDEAEAATARALDAAVSRAINTAVGPASAEIHGAISQTGLALELVRSRRAMFLATLQAREKCPACVIRDGKLALEKAAAPKK